jgi:hypothetical protein
MGESKQKPMAFDARKHLFKGWECFVWLQRADNPSLYIHNMFDNSNSNVHVWRKSTSM